MAGYKVGSDAWKTKMFCDISRDLKVIYASAPNVRKETTELHRCVTETINLYMPGKSVEDRHDKLFELDDQKEVRA